jgi:hypothetical protein
MSQGAEDTDNDSGAQDFAMLAAQLAGVGARRTRKGPA